MNKRKGKTIAIFSAKGGTGKTSTALNLAGILKLQEKKVIIIDMDLTGGAIATYLNKVPSKTIYNFADDYANKRYQKIEDYITTFDDSISFIASPKDPRQGAKVSSAYIDILIEKVVYDYDAVIIDMNHMLNEFNITVLDYVDQVLLVMTNDIFDIKNMRNVINIFNDASKTNYSILLNSSIHPNKKYYNLYDIKSMIKANIDYALDANFHIRSIDNYIVDSRIITLEKKLKMFNPKAYKAFMQMGRDLVGDDNE